MALIHHALGRKGTSAVGLGRREALACLGTVESSAVSLLT